VPIAPSAPQLIMPLALPDLQAALADHVVGHDRAELLASVVGDSIPAAARLRVYRNHVHRSLATALAATFPTVQALVGGDFFRAMARSFVGSDLPTQPVLSEYGAGFPRFVESYAPARGLPYLGDIARLDWALNVAFHSPAARRLASADLESIPVEELPAKSLALAPGAVVLRSIYPIDRVWAAAQPDGPSETVDLAAGGARLLVLRRPDDAGFVSLGDGEASFLEALAAGHTLEQAADSALAADAVFDLSGAFARLLHLQAFAAVQ
jgi:putative DNA-binding protein